tara:strand:+ start:1271 stop:1450 length:180 start_codon:yes stop_codon:yes gene_type:complete
MSKKIDKRINYVQTALKQDVKNQPNRSLKDFSELVTLIGDQFDDNTFNIKQEKICINQI